ncbi:pantetheine-phosphate adenylyltransferase [Actinomyces culturomici]|uniref:pantetheine-phosphate adenylyltransferase n=1 Tax=Actinomyces culturomici TaxID=1926276 RepID=UPI000E1FBB81|nr:pantetheine-phosphate adenylyltransferase [Actinomyces culturomici]
MTTALIAGSFDPITLGHVDLVDRTLRFADSVVVAVGVNSAKSYRFDQDARVAMVETALVGRDARIVRMDGTLLECADEVGADVVVKGVRTAADLEWELTQSVINRDLGGVETLLLPARPELSVVSSSVVRELLSLGLDASRYVPAAILPLMRDNDR